MTDGPTAPTTRALAAMHRQQIQRDPWPDFEAFERDRYPASMRARDARQWWRRAREEYGSVHEFTALSHALSEARAPIELLGALARLITDEVRHAAMAAAMAEALDPDTPFEWEAPRPPFPDAPREPAAILPWAADAILCSCCIGETVSRPLYETLATLITDPVPEAVVRQILRDEHLHARFGWEALAWLLPRLGEGEREWLEGRLAKRLAGFEQSCTAGHRLEDLVGVEVTIEPPGPDAPPNLGRMPPEVYATVFYATIEAEVLPGLRALGLDADRAWRTRPRAG